MLIFFWTPPNMVILFGKYLPAGRRKSTFSQKYKKTQQSVLPSQVHDYSTVLFPINIYVVHVRTDFVDRFLWVFKYNTKLNIFAFNILVGLVYLM